jgi:hypothetical protein
VFQIMVSTGVMISYFLNREPVRRCVSKVSDSCASSRCWAAHGQQSQCVANSLWLPTCSCWDDVSRVDHRQGKASFVLNLAVTHHPQESPRWLASKGRLDEALKNLAYLRKASCDSHAVRYELAEIEAAINEERESRRGLGIREAFFGKGNLIRFKIAFVIFLLQQWSGQNSVGYYAPQIFTSVRAYRKPGFFAAPSLNAWSVDRIFRNDEFPSCLGNLRHHQGDRNHDLCALRGRQSRS